HARRARTYGQSSVSFHALLPDSAKIGVAEIQHGMASPLKSFLEQLPPDLLMSLELASVHLFTDLPPMSAEFGAPLVQQIEHVIIGRDHGLVHRILGFENDPLGANGLENLPDLRVRVDERPSGQPSARQERLA